MKILVGNQTIEGAELYGERIWHEGTSRPALRVELNGGVTDAQIEALTAHDWQVCNDEGTPEGVQTGYNTLIRHELTFAQVATLEQVESERDAAQADASAAREENAQTRATVRGVVPLMADSAAVINQIMELLDEWMPGAYAQDDVRVYGGMPYRCVQAHDATDNPDWTPDTQAALWMQYHGTTPDTARDWIAPMGAHDMYRVGEYMRWTDGDLYRCVRDTSFDPLTDEEAWAAA